MITSKKRGDDVLHFEKMYTTIDAHVAGEGFRVIVHSPFQLQNQNVLKNKFTDNAFITRAKELLLNEPRGHRGMNGCIVIPSEKADFGVLFINHEQENHFAYSGLIATLTVLLETGQIPVSNHNQYQIETNQGIIIVAAQTTKHIVEQVEVNVENCSFIKADNNRELVEVDKRRYYLHELPKSIPALDMKHLSPIMKWGKNMAEKQQDTAFHGIVLIESLSQGNVRSVTFESDGVMLRSPGFDSTVAILASRHEKEEAVVELRNESIFGSDLTAKKSETSKTGFSIKSQGFVTGEHRFIYDPDDPLEQGFLLK